MGGWIMEKGKYAMQNDKLRYPTNELRWCRGLAELCVVVRLIAGSHIHGIGGRVGRRRINRAGKTPVLLLLLGHNLSCVELHQHCPIRL